MTHLTLALLATLLALPAAAHDFRFPVALPERVVDGDTLVVSLPGVHPLLGNRIKVRLRGIDAPESGHRAECEAERELGVEATQALRGMIATAERLELRRAKRGSFFRVVAEVWACGGAWWEPCPSGKGELCIANDDGLSDETCRSLGGTLVERGLAAEWDGSGSRPTPWCSED